ncbi:MAG TPA: M23 family metallopeptidase [Dermatophilaceae bacterium]|nr:M23 family metallopeptidase [Dermatophilaceae bacterium]
MSFARAITALLTVASAFAAPASPTVPPVPTSSPPGARVPQGRWVWPLDPHPEVVKPFDQPERPWLSGHRGVDLLGAVADPVRSPASGTIVFTGVVAGRQVLVVEHDGGLRSTFEPVASPLAVGSELGRGAAIGVVTQTPGHCAPSTCLHWGVLRGDRYLDPLALLEREPVRLLPLG